MIAVHVESNLPEVIQWLEHVRHQVPHARAAVARPSDWEARALSWAETVLFGLAASPEEQAAVPRFVRAVWLAALGVGAMEWGLSGGDRRVFNLGAELAQAAQLGVGSADPDVLNTLAEWVMKEKRLSSEEEADPMQAMIRVMVFFGLTGRAVTPGRSAAADKLLPHIQAYADQFARGIPAATQARWLEAVLDAWQAQLAAEAPEDFIRHLNL